MNMGGMSRLDFSDLDIIFNVTHPMKTKSAISTHNLLNWWFNFNQTCFKYIVKRGLRVDWNLLTLSYRANPG